jgi:succinyl-CoA synthetase alpha subunit
MKANELSDLLKKGDRVAVSNITGREASKVSAETQKYCSDIVAGWALGKGGQNIETAQGSIPVYSTFEEMIKSLPSESLPNKIMIYSPPEAVYGEVKEVIAHGGRFVETIFIITEHVSVEVTAKIHQICKDINVDVIGCNTLGMINVHDHVRIGAVGGDTPDETFIPGSVTVLSNSGNMVNTISSYVKASGMGTAFGVSTGKDALILLPMKDLLRLAEKDKRTKIIVLYVEPGGVYEREAIQVMKEKGFSKPVVVYVAGKIAEKYNVSLGHAGAVVDGKDTSASGKMMLFDDYFGIEPFTPEKHYQKSDGLKACLKKGIRVNTLHDIPNAVGLIADILEIKHDLPNVKPLGLNPWFVNLSKLDKHIPTALSLAPGTIPEPYASQFKEHIQTKLGATVSRQNMRNASHASSNDGATPRLYGYSVMELMRKWNFGAAIVVALTGEPPRDMFEEKLADMLLVASITNGPGTISAQGPKLSASAGNSPNTAMIATLATIGSTHGGNGSEAVQFLMDVFEKYDIKDVYDSKLDVKAIAVEYAAGFKKKKNAAQDASLEYARIPCLGHPVFKNDAVNFDPRERVIYAFIKENGRTNVFLEFYHHLVQALKDNGTVNKVMAVNVDAVLACAWLGICWRHLVEKRITRQRAIDIPFIVFGIGRVVGGAAEYLDHKDFGREMDMRIPTTECKELTKPKELK